MEPLAKEKSTPNLNPNSSDPAYKPLFQAAGRIAGLLRVTTAEPQSELPGALDDFLGAVYALIFAKQHGFKNRLDRPTKIASVEKLADQISAGKLPHKKKRERGFPLTNRPFLPQQA